MTDRNRFRGPLIALCLSALVFVALALFNEASWTAALIGFALIAVFIAQNALSAPADIQRAVSANEKFALDDEVIEKFIQALPDPCLLLNRRGLVIAFNGKAANLMPEITKGEPLSFYLRSPLLNDALTQALGGNAAAYVDIEEKIPVERWSSYFLSPLSLAGGEVDHVCVTVHDRTAEKRTERMRVDFVANASHELRTPLASLLGFVETLQGPARDDEKSRAQFLDIMRQQAKRMSRLIDDLLSLSRIEMHAHIQPQTPLDLMQLLQSTIDSLKPLATERGVALNLFGQEQRFMLRGDRDELFRAFENLIENAIKYGESGKKVDVEIGMQENMIFVSVRDYGAGIAEEHIPRLTERFYRVDEASSREKGGTGLGLAIVKHILNRHRGELSIESSLGQGTVFTAFLPPAS